MKDYKLFKIANNPKVVILRVAVFVLLVALLIVLRRQQELFDAVTFAYALFLMHEIYVHAKINRAKPPKKASEAQNAKEALEFKMNLRLERGDGEKVVQSIQKSTECKWIQEKIGGSLQQVVKVSKDDLVSQAQTLTKAVGGTYITKIDLFAAYLLLQEDSQKYLDKNGLTKEDVAYLLYWTRKKFQPQIEKDEDDAYAGSGAFDFFVYGWNAQLQKYAYDFTARALAQKSLPYATGRAREYDLLVQSLVKSKNNNALLIGDAGVGKTSLIAFFAKESYNARLPYHLSRKRVYTLLLDRVVAGTQTKGELEERITMLLAEIAHSGNVIVFIPNIEVLFGGGGLETDLSGVLYDYLKSSALQIIGTTTPQEYETRIKQSETTGSLFESIHMDEPDRQAARFMMFENIMHLEKGHRVTFTYKSVLAAIDYADSYQNTLARPGSIAVLLEDAASNNAMMGKSEITEADILTLVQKKTNIPLKKPTVEEKETLLHLEERMRQMVIDQDEAVGAIADAMRRQRSGMKNEGKPIASFLFLGPTGVGKTQTARALAQNYFGGAKNMIRIDMSEYNTPDSAKKLLGEMPGEDYIESLITKVSDQPFALLLLDEFEKADPHVLDLFLQILDDARLTNNKGDVASFENTIIIATSNAGSEYIRENINEPGLTKNLQNHLLREGIFRPELLNRFTEIVTFAPLKQESIKKITALEINKVLDGLEKEGVKVQIDEKVLEKIANEGYDQEFGARNITRYIEKNIESHIAKQILEDKIKKGEQKQLTVDENGKFKIQ